MTSEHGRWQSFLDSLASPGGNLFVLVMSCAALGYLLLHVLHHPEDANSEMKIAILTTFSTFTGALVGILRGRERAPNGNNNAGKPTATVV